MDISEHQTLSVGGMSCASCSARVERALLKVPGVTGAAVNLATERVTVTTDGHVNFASLAAAITKAGYTPAALPDGDTVQLPQPTSNDTLPVVLAALFSAPLMLPMLAGWREHGFMLPGLWQWILATPVQFWLGWRFYRSAWHAMRAGSGNMDLLVSLGTSAAYGLSVIMLWQHPSDDASHLYFESSSIVITLVLFGKWLESRAKRRTTDAIAALHALRPEQANVRVGEQTIRIPVTQLSVGDCLVVRAGERVPADAVILEGHSAVDEALITGESVPVSRGPGDQIVGGSINGEGLLVARTTAIGSQSTLSRLIRLVDTAQTTKAPIQRLVDRVSTVFVPLIIGLSVATFAGWMHHDGNAETALIHAVAVLVIACPCALGLATPTAILVGTGAAARHGILIKDAAALERIHAIDTMIFDKTGTLTEGRPTLVAQVSLEPAVHQTDDLVRLSASLQQASAHPLAHALLTEARQRNLALLPVARAHTVAGMGILGQVDSHSLALGSTRWFQQLKLNIPDDALARARSWEAHGWTVSWLARRPDQGPAQIMGQLAFADPVKPEARAALKRLSVYGIRPVMLTGDSPGSAAALAADLNLSEWHAQFLPQDKLGFIDSCRTEGRVTAMVGDGINDAPALAGADVGISVATGTDVAMSAASITLLRNDLRLINDAIDISRRTYGKIRQGLFWAFFYNLLGVPLAMLGLLSPAIAGGAMALSSVSVVANALLLRRWRPAAASQALH